MKNPDTGKRVARINPTEEWIVTEVPELRIVDDGLWQAAKARQGKISERYANVIAATRTARANRLNSTHRPRHLLSGLLERGVCGGPYAMRGQGRYGCSSHVMTGSCSNGRGIRRVEIEERVMAGLCERLMEPEAAAETMKAHAEETNRLNRERRASRATDRKELAGIKKKIASMLDAIEEGGYVRGMSDRLRELEARQDEIKERLSGADQAHRADPRREARRDVRHTPWRPRHHSRMGRKQKPERGERHPARRNVGLGGCGGSQRDTWP